MSLQCYKMRLHHSPLLISPEYVKLDNVGYLFGYVKLQSES